MIRIIVAIVFSVYCSTSRADYIEIGDWSFDVQPSFCFLTDCVAVATDVPSGSGYLAMHGDFATHGETMGITFPSPVTSVSLLATGASDITLTAFDASDNNLDSVTASPVTADNWATNQLLIESLIGIDRITVSANFAVIDLLRFGPNVEDFEGYVPGPNLPVLEGGAFLGPGVDGPFTFSSGAVLTQPIPNPAPVQVDDTTPIPEPSSALALSVVLALTMLGVKLNK